jgi:hypothetical protein
MSRKLPFAKTSIRLARRAFGLGYDTENKVCRATVLALSSALLSIMSGFTTFLGLAQYLGSTPALLATVAIQSLLFAISWMFGAELMRRSLRLTTLATYVIPMCISSWFSYSALLDYLYDHDRRVRDYQAELLDGANEQIQPLVAEVVTAHESRLAELHRETSAWSSQIGALAGPGIARSLEDFNESARNLKVLEAKHQTEVTEGGPRRPAGNGPKAKAIRAEINELKPTAEAHQAVHERLDGARSNFELSINKLSGDDASKLTAVDVQVAQASCKELVQATTNVDQAQVVEYCSPADRLHESLAAVTATSAFLSGNATVCEFDLNLTLDGVHACLAALPAPVEHEQAAIEAIESELAHIGPLAHHFELSVALLQRGEMLALLSLGLAIAFDLLVLMCGLVGNGRFSYLDMTDPRDLAESRTQAIDYLLAADGDALAKMRALLSAIEPLDVFGEQWGGFLSRERVRALSLGHAVDPLVKMGLLHPVTLDDERGFAVHFSFSLHLCEKLLMGHEHRLTEGDLLADIPTATRNTETTQPNAEA